MSEAINTIINEELNSLNNKNDVENQTNAENFITSKPKRPNKTEKKLLRYQKMLEYYKIKKATKKEQKVQKSLQKILEEEFKNRLANNLTFIQDDILIRCESLKDEVELIKENMCTEIDRTEKYASKLLKMARIGVAFFKKTY